MERVGAIQRVSHASGAGLRAVVVDADAASREACRHILEDAGCEVVVVASGDEALFRFHRVKPHLMLLDATSPSQEAFETCRRLRRVTGGSQVTLVLLSGADSIDHARALDVGADGFLRKPVERDALLVRVQSLVRQTALLRRREDLTAYLVHDLKNNLSSVMANIQLAMRARDPMRVKAPLEDAISASLHLRRMMLDLLDMSRNENGVLQVSLSEVDVGLLLSQVRTELRGLASFRGQIIEIAVPPGTTVQADAELLLRVLYNLVENASKHSPRGGVIWIEATRHGGDLEVCVRDQGGGIPIADRERVFDKYARVEPASQQRDGHGLGLAFCRTVVELHGGRIWVEDNVPRGACLRLSLPRSGG